ncbi:MAG: hypothetical protein IV100_05795 [Myxococcales bacterium]|nr:hypothetical protein [Myxococcales bacterium]
MNPHEAVDVSPLAEAVDFRCPFFATRDAIQVADLGEGDRNLAGGASRVLEVLTDAKNALLLDLNLPERPDTVPFRTTTLPVPVDMVLTITWEEELPVRVDLDVARPTHS